MSNHFTEFKHLSVLIVDDSQVQQEHLSFMCKYFGISHIKVANNGKEALQKLKENKSKDTQFDLALIDLEMPEMDGISLLREIASGQLLSSIIINSAKDPSLILSVGAMAENDGLNVLGTFKKPIRLAYLHSSLNQLLQFDPEHDRRNCQLNITVEELGPAIDNNELIINFQPKLTANKLMLNSVEVLLRWKHKVHGIVPPDSFIPLAERFGIIDKLTYKLFQMALTQLKTWLSKGANFNLAINLSPLSLNETELAEHIVKIVKEYKINPEQIILEITENTVAEQISQAIETLAKLRLSGFQISIDDFGTGYASIQQLSRVPATELKIDKSLIQNIATRPQQQAILKNTLNMARDLRLKTVVEGVEYEDDFLYLKKYPIDLMQGYLLARPMNSQDFEYWWLNELSQKRKKLMAL